MKYFLCSFIVFVSANHSVVVPNYEFSQKDPVGTLICNDGALSPTCDFCDSGCCSHHGGC